MRREQPHRRGAQGPGTRQRHQLQLHGVAHRRSADGAGKSGSGKNRERNTAGKDRGERTAVPTAQAKAEVEKIVSEIPQVKTVVNELQIAGASSAASRSNDAYITSKVKANFLGNGKFRPTDIKVVTEAGVVFLLGLVTREEADAATEVARGTGGVQKVVRVFEYVVPPAKK
ncbi:MAG: BON domain-containing protein [Betaproteobacteria bacterium]|nr:MAG: BON domain-containing protein [Betaproteobacteria bacterium]